jgi:urease alpha subunit
VSFADWVNNGWLVAHKSGKQEIGNLLGIVARDLKDSQAGYRASRDNHHYRVIQSLELTLGKDPKFIRAFDAFRKKRNVSSYDIGGAISHREVEEMISIAQGLQQDVEQWIRTNHGSLL